MKIEDQLKSIILERYKSIRAFTLSIDIPYTTLDSVFKRGIQNAGIGTMLKVFDALDIDIESISTGELTSKTKKSPAPEEPDAEDLLSDDEKEDFKLFRQAMIRMGYVGEEDDLTDAQITILCAVMDILDAAFPGRSQNQVREIG